MDALLLLAAISDARRALVESIVQAVQAVGPHGLLLELATTSGRDTLLVTADEALPRLARGARGPAHGGPPTPLAAAAQRGLPGSRLVRIDRHGLDRVVHLDFAASQSPEPAWRLSAELFGHQPNLILLDATSDRILEMARRIAIGSRAFGPDLPYLAPPAVSRPDPLLLETVEALATVIQPSLTAGMTAAAALRQHLAGLDA